MILEGYDVTVPALCPDMFAHKLVCSNLFSSDSVCVSRHLQFIWNQALPPIARCCSAPTLAVLFQLFHFKSLKIFLPLTSVDVSVFQISLLRLSFSFSSTVIRLWCEDRFDFNVVVKTAPIKTLLRLDSLEIETRPGIVYTDKRPRLYISNENEQSSTKMK